MGYLSEKDKTVLAGLITPEDTSIGLVSSAYWEAVTAFVGGAEIQLWSSESDDRKEELVENPSCPSGMVSRIWGYEDIRHYLIRELNNHILLCKELRKEFKKSLKEENVRRG